jgi:DNA-3-methyladenine glycosylase
MHWCLNAVTREVGYGSAVLIRALEPLEGVTLMRRRRPKARVDRDLANGPGKLCEALGIDRAYDGAPLDRGPLRIVAGDEVPLGEVSVSPRIGITKAAGWPLRYFVQGSEFVSRTPTAFPVVSVAQAAKAIARLPKR